MMEDYGWAACWPKGTPGPFIIISTASLTRRGACESVGKSWQREGETAMQGWRRAYRAGCRVIRVRITPAFQSEDKP